MGKNKEVSFKKQSNAREWIATALAGLTFAFSIFVSFTASNTVEDIKVEYENQISLYNDQNQSLQNELSNIQTQYQSLESEIINVQDQYQILENIINQHQSVDVIEARDNDVLIMTPDGKWIVIPMIEKDDFEFSDEIIETQYNQGESTLPRVKLFNVDSDDWSTRDSFTYTLPLLSINQNKMVSLYQFISSIDVEFKLYDENEIDYYVEKINVFNQDETYTYLNVFENISPQVQYVTHDSNIIDGDGIEKIKISIIIEFDINDVKFSIPYVFDEYVTVNQDY